MNGLASLLMNSVRFALIANGAGATGAICSKEIEYLKEGYYGRICFVFNMELL